MEVERKEAEQMCIERFKKDIRDKREKLKTKEITYFITCLSVFLNPELQKGCISFTGWHVPGRHTRNGTQTRVC